MHNLSRALILITLCAASLQAAIVTKEVTYLHDGQPLQGYFAYDDAIKGKRPAVFIVHEWYGHGPYVRRRAEQLAGLGYLAFAGDMYGKGVFAKDHAEAGALAGGMKKDWVKWLGRGLAGLVVMKQHELADTARTAAMGYCFGGSSVLELARAGVDLKGVVSFHGALNTEHPAEPGTVKAKVLVLHGADDHHANAGVAGFQEEMRKAKADWQLTSYGGAVHSFTVKEAGNDPSKGMAYNEAADRRSWQAMQDFFSEIFR